MGDYVSLRYDEARVSATGYVENFEVAGRIMYSGTIPEKYLEAYPSLFIDEGLIIQITYPDGRIEEKRYSLSSEALYEDGAMFSPVARVNVPPGDYKVRILAPETISGALTFYVSYESYEPGIGETMESTTTQDAQEAMRIAEEHATIAEVVFEAEPSLEGEVEVWSGTVNVKPKPTKEVGWRPGKYLRRLLGLEYYRRRW